MSYEQYIEHQIGLFDAEEKEAAKQQEMRQVAYEDLLKRYHLLRDSLEKEQDKCKELHQMLLDYDRAYDTFKERIVEIPFSTVHNMFLLEERPTSLFMCIDDKERLKWVKSEREMTQALDSERIPK